jgi:hypothetical protein
MLLAGGGQEGVDVEVVGLVVRSLIGSAQTFR